MQKPPKLSRKRQTWKKVLQNHLKYGKNEKNLKKPRKNHKNIEQPGKNHQIYRKNVKILKNLEKPPKMSRKRQKYKKPV